MRKFVVGMLAVALLLSITAFAGEKGKAVTVKGWVSDTECAAHGDKKCANEDHIKMGSKLALVTDGDNKIWTVENPDKLADHQGHYVQVKGVANAEAATIRVETASLLAEPNNDLLRGGDSESPLFRFCLVVAVGQPMNPVN